MTGGQALRALRLREELTLYQLAELANLDQSYVSRLEHGTRHPSRGTVELLNAAGRWGGTEAALLLQAFGYAPDDAMTHAQRVLVAL